MLDLDNLKSVHFFGIGGIGVSAIARMFLNRGVRVSGSDLSESRITRELEYLGVSFLKGQDISQIPAKVDLVVYTIALENYASKLLSDLKQRYKEKLMSYPEVRTELSKKYKTIAIAGTHGKTTTTAMLAKIMVDAGLSPTVIVGSLIREYGSNYIQGQSQYLLLEADEYKRNFLSLSPYMIGITNVELDHVDCYESLTDLEDTFKEFIARLQIDGKLFTNIFTKNQLRVKKANIYDNFTNPKLHFPSDYNLANAKLALSIANQLGIDENKARKSLSEFTGTWRRFEYLGKYRAAKVYDDYAHHPTEISALLAGVVKVFPNKKITLIFQPHTYSRTRALFDDFILSFKNIPSLESLVVMPIYPAREIPDGTTTSERLCEEIRLAIPNLVVHTTKSHDDTMNLLERLNIKKNSLILTVGAGETNLIGEALIKNNNNWIDG